LESVGIQSIFGQFKEKDTKCKLCNNWFIKHVEKQTDVNIVTCLFKFAIQDTYDRAYIVSGDSDLIPAIKAVKELFPDKEIGIVIPISRCANELKSICDFKIRVRAWALNLCILAYNIVLKDGTTISCPPNWK